MRTIFGRICPEYIEVDTLLTALRLGPAAARHAGDRYRLRYAAPQPARHQLRSPDVPSQPVLHEHLAMLPIARRVRPHAATRRREVPRTRRGNGVLLRVPHRAHGRASSAPAHVSARRLVLARRAPRARHVLFPRQVPVIVPRQLRTPGSVMTGKRAGAQMRQHRVEAGLAIRPRVRPLLQLGV